MQASKILSSESMDGDAVSSKSMGGDAVSSKSMGGKIYGYARCSTNESRQDVQRQIRELKAMGAADATIYREYESGSKTDRAELLKLLDIVTRGDTIVTTEVSRVTRSTRQLCEIIDLAGARHIKLVIGSFVVDFRAGQIDPMTEGMLKMMGVFAELERKMTVQRVRSGLDNARAKGVRLGRPAVKRAEDVPAGFRRYYERYREGDFNFREACRLAGVGKTAGYKYKTLLEAERCTG